MNLESTEVSDDKSLDLLGLEVEAGHTVLRVTLKCDAILED